jgi:hypothetical protein
MKYANLIKQSLLFLGELWFLLISLPIWCILFILVTISERLSKGNPLNAILIISFFVCYQILFILRITAIPSVHDLKKLYRSYLQDYKTITKRDEQKQ